MKSALGTVKDLIRFLDYLSEEKETGKFNVNLVKTSGNSYKLIDHKWE